MSVQTPATRNAPPLGLPLAYFVTGLLGLLGGLVDLAWHRQQFLTLQPGSPGMLSTTHFYTLGFLTMVMMGALYQLVPVVMNTRIASVRAGFLQYGVYVAGVAILIDGMAAMRPPRVLAGGSLVIVAVTIFVANLAQSVRRAKSWTISSYFVMTGLGYLGLTVTMGWLLALNLAHPIFPNDRELYLHLALGVVGWFTLTIVGVSYKLVPMFVLSHGHLRWGWWTLGLFNGAILSVAMGIWLGNVFYLTAAFLGLLAVAGYLADLGRMWHDRTRRQLDPALVLALSGPFSLVIILAMAGGAMGNGELWPAVIYLVFNGWLSLTVMGLLQKIVPFLIWLDRYSDQMGRGPVPRMKDIFAERWSWQIGVIYALGVVIAFLSAIARVGDGFAMGVSVQALGLVGLLLAILRAVWRQPARSPAAPHWGERLSTRK